MSVEQRDREMAYPALDHEFFNFLGKKKLLLSENEGGKLNQASFFQAMEAVHQASLEQYVDFLDDLAQDPRRHQLPQAVVTALIDRGFTLAEEAGSEAGDRRVSDKLVYQIERAIQLSGDFKRRDKNDESLTDRSFRASLELYSKHPAAVEKFFSQMTQEYTVRPDIFMTGIADMMWRPEVSNYFKTDAIHGVNYLLSFDYNKVYQQVMIDNLDFNDPRDFFKTATFLEFIKRVYITSQDFAFSEDHGGQQLVQILERAVHRSKPMNYLLRARANELYEAISAGEELFIDHDHYPFIVEPGVYGFDFGDGLRIARADDEAKIIEQVEKLKTIERKLVPPQWMIDEAIRNGEQYVQWSPPEDLMAARQAVWEQLREVIQRPISLADIAVDRQTGDDGDIEEEKKRRLFDFNYLMSAPIRKKIEADFGINLGDISLREKFYFLDFLKLVSDRDVSEVKKFVSQFGRDGIRAFLSLESEPAGGKQILSIGQRLPAEIARAIFAKYGELVDAADGIDAYLRDKFAAATDRPKVASAINHRLLQQGKELLAACARQATGSLDEIESRLESLRTDVNLFVNSFREVYAGHDAIDWSEIRDVSFQSIDRPSAGEIQIMAETIQRNYAGNPLLEGVLESFQSALAKPHNTWYLLKRGDEIISFYRFEDEHDAADQPTGVTEFASFNTDRDYQHGGLGRAIMKNAIHERGADHVIVASTDPHSAICQFYVQQAGFVIDGVAPYKDTGISVFKIRHDAAARYEPVGPERDLGEAAQVVSSVERLLADGQVLTTYHQDKTTGHFYGQPAEPVRRPVERAA